MPSISELLERESSTVDLEPRDFERLLRRRDRKRRNRRLSAGALAIILALVSFVALTRAFGPAERPADEPPKPPGIFSEVGGWIAYGDEDGIWAADPSRPDDPDSRIRLSTERGTPLAWSRDGSKLLILGYERDPLQPHRLFVLNPDGSETSLATIEGAIVHGGFVNGGSFSPDGSQVIYTERASIYVVDSQGGTPQILFTPDRRWSRSCGCFFRHPWPFNPRYSPGDTLIAYTDGIGDNSHQLRVMNADGSGTRLLVDEQSGGPTMHNLAWSPDGERLVFGLGTSVGIYVVGSDGSGLALVIPGATYPYWSPDGSRIAYQPCDAYSDCSLQIADADGTHVVVFGYGHSGPWNPLVQPEPEVPE